MSTKSLITRSLERGDYDKGYLQLLTQLTEVGDISRELFNKTFDKINNKSSSINIFVIEDISKEKIIGCATLYIEQKFIHQCSSVGHIEDVVTDISYRGKGLGKLITLHCINYAKKNKCYKIELDCADHNIPFYNKCGFKVHENHMVIYVNKKSKL